jgi:hypothetical protein
LLKDVKVKAMIAQRTKGALAKVEAAADATIAQHTVTSEKVIAALAQMGLAHATMAKFLKVTSGGDLDLDFTGATQEELKAIWPMIQELKTERYFEGKGENKREIIRTTVKMVERKGVLELLGKWNKLKLWAAETPAGVVFTHELSIQELEAYAETGVLPEHVRHKIPQLPHQVM